MMIISLLSTNDMFQLQLSSPEYSLRFCDKEKKRLHKKLERERVEDGVRHRERERERESELKSKSSNTNESG
jgi:hypothetical protein